MGYEEFGAFSGDRVSYVTLQKSIRMLLRGNEKQSSRDMNTYEVFQKQSGHLYPKCLALERFFLDPLKFVELSKEPYSAQFVASMSL